MDFLPQDYKIPDATTGYMRLQQGKNKFRVVSSAIIGNEFWITKEDGKRSPVRKRMNEQINISEIEEDEQIKHFWAFIVWNYDTNSLQILELTQKSLQKAIKAYVDNEDYGDPKGYDITITRDGEKLNTEYSVIASPPKPLNQEIKKLVDTTPINLEALYEGGDPFAQSQQEVVEQVKKEFDSKDIKDIDF